MDILIVLFWATIGSFFSLLGGIAMLRTKSVREKVIELALPFGAGALLAAAFLDLLPEAFELSENDNLLTIALGGFLLFFVLERLLGWFHHHHHDDETHGVRDKTHTNLVIIGDTLHNLIDGIAIGAAFLVSIPTGIITAVAVAAHEIPQEIGDFGILLGKGMKASRVLLVNLLSSLATVVAALLVFVVGSENFLPLPTLLALAAGMFIYIAASDIIPDIHEKPHRQALRQSLTLLLGVFVVGLAIGLVEYAIV